MKKKILPLVFALSSLPTIAYGAEGPSISSVVQSVDMMWVAIATLLVFFMHAGFAMVETGFTRAKNALNILMKNFLTMALGALIYFAIGYGIMFGDSLSGLVGSSYFFLQNAENDIGFFVFQAVFAATCATIISGAVAERMKLSSYLMLTVCMVMFIYPVVGHWVWGGGFLSELGFIDFAGSTVVHLTGATGALAAVLLLGGRIGKYDQKTVNVIPGHNIPLGALGVFILWFGWFGFNAGSSLAADPALVPMIITTTLLSASAGIVSSAIYSYIKFKQMDATLTLNGALGGLVGITAGTADVSFFGAVAIGFIAGIILIEAVPFIDQKLKLDDPVGAIAVHGFCGIWGTIAVGLFATNGGLLYGGGTALLVVQSIGVLAVIAWTFGLTFLSLKFITLRSSIRVSREEEVQGLDFTEHGSTAYDMKGESFGPANSQSSFGYGLVNRLNQLGNADHQPHNYNSN
ncbi:ammonium transporter [Bacillus sp. Marseille-Q3570]|uniref:ammonium transporter n=1 Tax=Bacillus sp. Marseille-Q3570 TaxID=2963522 RepID=UPI0037BFF267